MSTVFSSKLIVACTRRRRDLGNSRSESIANSWPAILLLEIQLLAYEYEYVIQGEEI
jgi:hypothetical protein